MPLQAARGIIPIKPQEVTVVKERGLIFDIQGFSVHDGPGTRTLVFLSGCPMRCAWCANPEGQAMQQNLMFAPGRCKALQNHCSRCVTACPRCAITPDARTGQPRIQRTLCVGCDSFLCANACNYEALRISGTYYTVDELMKVLRRDRNFWSMDGGVTFGGGDPLAQGEFLLQVLKACRLEQIHTAIETEAYAREELFLQVMDGIDFAFVDIKHMDTMVHQAKTGVGNELVLGNLRALKRSGWNRRIILRTPIIPGYNDSLENARATVDFMKENGYFEINLLPFHRLGTSKWEQLGRRYPYRDQPNLPKEQLEPLQNFYLDAGIACYLDADVAYSVHPVR